MFGKRPRRVIFFCLARTIHKRKEKRSKVDNLENQLTMLTTIAIVLLVLWILGLVTNYTIGGFIYVLLVAAIILFLIRIIRGENPIK